jgi:hypothetical protein
VSKAFDWPRDIHSVTNRRFDLPAGLFISMGYIFYSCSIDYLRFVAFGNLRNERHTDCLSSCISYLIVIICAHNKQMQRLLLTLTIVINIYINMSFL